MKRHCIYCNTSIYECMGYVLPRDVLAMLEGTLPLNQVPRELCPSQECNNKWLEFLKEEQNVKN